MEPPRIVAVLFTDVEGSTPLLGALGDAFVDVIERQRALLATAAGARRGSGYPTGGDGCIFVFGSAGNAVAAAVEAQCALAAEPWPGGTTVRVRMAIHAGEVAEVGDELYGMALHQASRIMAVTYGGQVVVSDTAVGLIEQLAPDISLLDLGEHRLRDIVRPVRLHQAVAEGIATVIPAPEDRHERCEQPASADDVVRGPRAGARRAGRSPRFPAARHAHRGRWLR